MVYSASTAFLEALLEGGIKYIYGNFGSDHPAILESLAEARSTGRKMPEVITAPIEQVGLHLAMGYAHVTGKPQCVMVHVECGTQNLGGAIHNVYKGRQPVLIFAGSSPFTLEQELKGSRNEFIQWIQDVHDQRGIMRGYTNYTNEFRTGKNIKQVTHRALQFANSDPKGPVYLVGPREVMEEEVEPLPLNMEEWGAINESALPPKGVKEIVEALLSAKHPLVVTSYVGKNPKTVPLLVKLADRLAFAVHESCPSAMNFPASHPAHQGCQWNGGGQSPALAEADVVLVIDSDIPWIPRDNKPAKGAKIFHLDVDPLKAQMPLFYIPAQRRYKVDAETALTQILEGLEGVRVDEKAVKQRLQHLTDRHTKRIQRLDKLEVPADTITTPILMGYFRKLLPTHSTVMIEGITQYGPCFDHFRSDIPGQVFASGAGSLGWGLAAAMGARQALNDTAPKSDAIVATVTGDGSYMFGMPSASYWVSKHYELPFLAIILNNGGWNAPKFSALGVHPTGFASKSSLTDLHISFDPPADYGMIAEAAGAWSKRIQDVKDVESGIKEAIQIVQGGRSAVLNVFVRD